MSEPVRWPTAEDYTFMFENGVMPLSVEEWRAMAAAFRSVAEFCDHLADAAGGAS